MMTAECCAKEPFDKHIPQSDIYLSSNYSYTIYIIYSTIFQIPFDVKNVRTASLSVILLANISSSLVTRLQPPTVCPSMAMCNFFELKCL